MENPTKMDDLGVPLFLETPISWYLILEVRLLDQVQPKFPPFGTLRLLSLVSWSCWDGTARRATGGENTEKHSRP